jgi:hypothetical protein
MRGRSRGREPDENPDLDYELGLRKRPVPWKVKARAYAPAGAVGLAALAALCIGLASRRQPDPPATAAAPVEAMIVSAKLPAPDFAAARAIAAVSAGPATVLPPSQAGFLAAIDGTRKAFRAGENDLRKGAARMQRARALCAALPSRVAKDWYGVVTELTSNGAGKGAMTVRVGDNVTVATWHDWLSDTGHWTLMEAGTPAHDVAMTLRVGDKVRLSGSFFPDADDCLYEQSYTQRGSMTAPEFTFRFEALARVP